jgi:tetratricopeptide (TPR) repeat protein
LLRAQENQRTEAIQLLREAANLRPQSVLACNNLGAAYLKGGQVRLAIEEFRSATRLAPEDFQSNYYLGQALAQAGEYRGAAQSLLRAHTLKPENADLTYDLALCYSKIRRYTESADLLERMPGVESSADAQALWGEVEEKRANYIAAANHLQLAAQLQPTEERVFDLGVEFLRHWTWDAAIAVLGRGVALFPNSLRMQAALGVAQYGKGDYNSAIDSFAHAVKASPNERQAELYFEFLGKSCSQSVAAELGECRRLAEYARLHPQNASAATYAAASMLRSEAKVDAAALDTAVALLQQALRLEPDLAEAHYQLAVALQLRQQWAQSIDECKRALRLQPGLGEAHYRLAQAYLRTGQRQMAQQEFELHRRAASQQQAQFETRYREVKQFLVTVQ